MAGAYRCLFEIACEHAYFSDRVCLPMRVTPSEACTQLLARYRLLFRPLPGGGAVYYADDDPLGLLAAFDEIAPFAFMLSCADPHFLSYTEIDFPEAGFAAPGLYYFDNCDSDGACLLHPPGRPFSEGRLPYRAPRFLPPQGRTPASLAVLDRFQAQRVWPSAGAPPPADGYVDLGALPCARYSLQTDDGGADFYLNATHNPGNWGVAAIFGGGSKQAAQKPERMYAIDRDGRPHQRTYRIVFGARQVRWRYYIVSAGAGEAAPDGEVIAVDARAGGAAKAAPPVFMAAGTRMVNGRAASIFVSTTVLPLAQVPDTRRTYCFRPAGNGIEQGRNLKLPYAGPLSLAIDDNAPHGLLADIYVYL